MSDWMGEIYKRIRYESYDNDKDITGKLSRQQTETLMTCLHIIQDYRSVVICEATGVGKTYIASAMAAILCRHRHVHCVVIVPAHLIEMWKRVMGIFQISASFRSYQTLSLGKVTRPDTEDVLWIADEAHMMKNTGTLRYKHFMELTKNDLVCLITATPVTMGVANLEALTSLCGFQPVHDARIVLTGYARALMPIGYRPELGIDVDVKVSRRFLDYCLYEDHAMMERLETCIEKIEWLSVSQISSSMETGIVGHVLRQRLSSHYLSCLATLKRLEKYYYSCRIGDRQALSRTSFRRMMGMDVCQKLLPFEDHVYDCVISMQDSKKIDGMIIQIRQAKRLLESIRNDRKLASLRQYLAECPGNEKIVIFTQFADTAVYLSNHLKDTGSVALMTASLSRYNGLNVDREILYEMFRPEGQMPAWWSFGMARILVCSDAFACGQNFHLAVRLIHFDMPWNPATLKQREGRILRNGQSSSAVEMVILRMDDSHDLKKWNCLDERGRLMAGWVHDYEGEDRIEELVLIPEHGIPGLWARIEDAYFPIDPQSFLNAFLRFKKAEVSTLWETFGTQLKVVRKNLIQDWELVRKMRHGRHAHENLRLFMENAMTMILLPKWKKQESDKIFISKHFRHVDNQKGWNCSSICYRFELYPQMSTQDIHKLSTDLGA